MNSNLFAYKAVNHSSKQFVDGMADTNDIESDWAASKRGLNSMFRPVSVKHLQRYVDGFTYRLNEGNMLNFLS
ncbi:transposase [Akkermansia sp.]|uniref:transposase n=1 Tax=Akkermansia sp. TaxID=1872421 RepID=UPI003AB32594